MEIVSLLSNDSSLKMALWENPTTSRVLFSKLEELQTEGANSKGGKEMASLVLPNVIKAFQEESEEVQAELCQIVRRSPGFLSRCFLSLSEERKGGPVNEALFAIAEMDRKGAVVDQMRQLVRKFVDKRTVPKHLVGGRLLLTYLKGPDEQAKIAVLNILSSLICSLSETIIPSIRATESADTNAEASEVAREMATFLYEVLVECERQAKAPKDEGLIAVYRGLTGAIGALLEWNAVPERMKHDLLLTCLKVSQCSNFALNVSVNKFVQRNYYTWVFGDDVAYVDVVTELFRLYGV